MGFGQLFSGINATDIGNFALSYGTAKQQLAMQKAQIAEQKRLNEFNMDWTQHANKYTVADMLDAGLNPALMYGNGASPMSASSLNAGDAGQLKTPQLGLSNGIALEQLAMQKANNEADVNLKNAQADLARSQSGKVSYDTTFARMTEDLRILSLSLGNSHTATQTRVFEEQIKNMQSEIIKRSEEVKELIRVGKIRDEELVKIKTENESLIRELEHMKSTNQYNIDIDAIRACKQLAESLKNADDAVQTKGKTLGQGFMDGIKWIYSGGKYTPSK